MPVKIFVGKLPEGTQSSEIRSLFQKYGRVVECDVVSTYGFVHMEKESDARTAIASLHGTNVKGSQIAVELSTLRTQGRVRKMQERGGRSAGSSRFNDRRRERISQRNGPYSSRSDDHMERRSAVLATERERLAIDPVRTVLELYFRDPVAFDQYAKSYVYGERSATSRDYFFRPSKEYYDRQSRITEGGMFSAESGRRLSSYDDILLRSYDSSARASRRSQSPRRSPHFRRSPMRHPSPLRRSPALRRPSPALRRTSPVRLRSPSPSSRLYRGMSPMSRRSPITASNGGDRGASTAQPSSLGYSLYG